MESPIDALKKAANLNGKNFQSLSDFKRLSLYESIDKNDGDNKTIIFYENEVVVLNGEMKDVRRLFGRNKKTLFDGVGWILNEDMNSCMICTIEFSFFNGRHHCRACGNIVCGICSPQFIIIHELSQFGKQRVCNQCYWGQEIVYMSNNRIAKDLNIDFIDEDLMTAAIYSRLNNENPIKKLLRLNANDFNNINTNTSNYNAVEENTWNLFEKSDTVVVIDDISNNKTSPITEILTMKESENNITSTIGAQIHSLSTNILNQNRLRPSSSRLVSTFFPSLKKSDTDIDNQFVGNTQYNLPSAALSNEDITTFSITKISNVNDNSVASHQSSNSSSNSGNNYLVDINSTTSNVSAKVFALNNKTVNNKSITVISTNNASIIKRIIPNEDKNSSKVIEAEACSIPFPDDASLQLINDSDYNTDTANVDEQSSMNSKYADLPDCNRNENKISDINHVITTDKISNTSIVNISPSFNSINISVNNTSIIPNSLFVIKTHLCATIPSHKNEYIGTKVFLNILATDNVRKINNSNNQIFYYVISQLKHSSDNSGSKAYVIDVIINSEHALQIEDKVIKDAICSQLIEIILVNPKSNLVYSGDLISHENCCKLAMKYTLPLITNNYKSSADVNEPSGIYIPNDLQKEDDTLEEINNVIDDNLVNNKKLKELDSDDDDDDITPNNSIGRTNCQNDDNSAKTIATLRSSNSSISATAVRASNSNEIQKWNVFIKSTAIILALGMIGKKNPLGIMYKRKLILSSEPSLIYVDPVSMQIKGKIKWDKVAIPRASIFSANCFEILSDKRTYRFYSDNNNQAAEWVMEINNAAKSLLPNFLGSDPESIYFSP